DRLGLDLRCGRPLSGHALPRAFCTAEWACNPAARMVGCNRISDGCDVLPGRRPHPAPPPPPSDRLAGQRRRIRDLLLPGGWGLCRLFAGTPSPAGSAAGRLASGLALVASVRGAVHPDSCPLSRRPPPVKTL